MSSGVEVVGEVAPVVFLPAAVVYGAGWLAWQGGKLLIEAGRAVNRHAADKQRQMEEAARHRKRAAIAAHGQLVDMCEQILAQLEDGSAKAAVSGFAEIEQLKYELKKICEEQLPDDAARIESMTSFGHIKLDRIISRQKSISAMALSDSETGLYSGLSVADLMEDLRVALSAMEIHESVGPDVRAADPAVLERTKLNKAFAEVTAKVMAALEFVDGLETDYGLRVSDNAWFESCFNGIDILIDSLCRPTTSNQALKKGIRRLEEAVSKYEIMVPSIEKELKRFAALYDVYKSASKALGEKTESIKAFKSASEIEKKLRYLETRAERAAQCAEIYKKLGSAAYMCYALDQELQAMGYEVHTRKKIAEMMRKKPQHARLGENKMPFYSWNEEDLTQLYSIAADCALQVIVHDDGTVSMQAIAEEENEDTVAVQKKHCSQLKTVFDRLRKNWFILYSYEETEPAEKVMTVSSWRASEDNARRERDEELITDQRKKGKEKEQKKQTQ